MFKNIEARTFLALFITIVTVIAVTVLAFVSIVTTDAEASSRSQSIMNVVLPLFGTWIGTVLAYYFSRDNFETASARTQQIIQQITPEERLQSTPVESVMTKSIFSINDTNTAVKDAYEQLKEKSIKRLLVLNNANILQALLFEEGLADYLLRLRDEERTAKTLHELLTERNELIQPVAYVAQNASLADAKKAMEDKKAKVVLVTKTGKSNESVLGMLTNTDVAKHSHP
jgi:signal-transduction protein with cAMP-binding, CBS, and nucleotidyltransferase domain